MAQVIDVLVQKQHFDIIGLEIELNSIIKILLIGILTILNMLILYSMFSKEATNLKQ